MKDCVIFAAWAPHRHRIQAYINVIKNNWLDCDIFVGINPGTDPLFIIKLNEIGITNIIYVNPELAVNSDASAFQAALSLYKNSNKNYKNVFFMHTKGMSYTSDDQWTSSRDSYFDDFARRRSQHEKMLEPDDVGGCATVSHFDFTYHCNDYIRGITKYIDTPYTNIMDLKWLITHYSMKNEIVKYFVDNCKPEFFTTNLNNRYFFEFLFTVIVELISNKKRTSCVFWDANGIHPDSEQLYKRVVNEWNERNKI